MLYINICVNRGFGGIPRRMNNPGFGGIPRRMNNRGFGGLPRLT